MSKLHGSQTSQERSSAAVSPCRLKPSILRHGLMNGLIAFPNENYTLGNRFLHQNGTVGQKLRKKKNKKTNLSYKL